MILIVEDDLPNLHLIDTHLTNAGFATHTVTEGEAALAWLHDHTPDLIVLDMMLPGISGFEVARQVRETLHPALPILVVSAMEMLIRDHIYALEAGASDFLAKPFHRTDLLARVHRLLDTPAWASPTVLIADDDANLRGAFAKALRLRNFQVAEATNGTEALAYLQEKAPSMLIMDLNIPGTDGMEVLRKLRKMEHGTDLKIAIVTGAHQSEYSPEVDAADLFLLKPVSTRELVTLVDRLLDDVI